MNPLPSELLSRSAGVCVLDDLNNVDLLSDHSPVFVSLGRVAKGGVNRGGVPRWVADRSDFPGIVGEQFGRSMTGLVEEPFDRLHRYKEAMKRAAAMIVNRATADECVSPASRLFWISAARSAVRARSRIRIARAIDRFPGLNALFNSDDCFVSDPSGLHTFVCDINREDLKEQLAEVGASDLDDDEKSRKRSQCHTRHASWSPKGRSVVGITVLDEGGSPTSDKDAFTCL